MPEEKKKKNLITRFADLIDKGDKSETLKQLEREAGNHQDALSEPVERSAEKKKIDNKAIKKAEENEKKRQEKLEKTSQIKANISGAINKEGEETPAPKAKEEPKKEEPKKEKKPNGDELTEEAKAEKKLIDELAKEHFNKKEMSKAKWGKVKDFVGSLLTGPAYQAYKDGVLSKGELGYHILNTGMAKMLAMGGATDRAKALQDMNPVATAIGAGLEGRAQAVKEIAERDTKAEAGHATDAKTETQKQYLSDESAITQQIIQIDEQINALQESKTFLSAKMDDKAFEMFSARMNIAKGLNSSQVSGGGGLSGGLNLPVFSIQADGRGQASTNKDTTGLGVYNDAKGFKESFSKSGDKRALVEHMRKNIDNSIKILEEHKADLIAQRGALSEKREKIGG